MRQISILVFSLISSFFLYSQETIKQEYRLYTSDRDNPILVLNKETKDDTLYLYNGKAATLPKKVFKKKDQLRFRCYALANNLEIDSPEMNELYEKEKRKYELEKLISTARSSNNKNIVELPKEERREIEKLTVIDIEGWKKELKEINEVLKKVNCPKGFERVKGKLKVNGNYLIFSPFEYQENSRLPETTRNLIRYFNGDYSPLKKDVFGLKLPSTGQLKITSTGLQAGALTIPLKLYLNGKSDSIPAGTNNIQTDAKFAIFTGYQWGKHGYNSKGEIKSKEMKSLNIILGASKLTLNPGNTDGAIEKEVSIATIDTGLAFAFAYNKFNLFVGAGFDIPLNRIGADWIFHGSPWVGVGVGYSILNFGL